MIGVDIFSILTNNKDISDVVGRNIYPNDASVKETPLPCIVYWLQNLNLDYCYDNTGTLEMATIDLVTLITSKTYQQVQSLYQDVMLCLVDYSGGRIKGIKHETSVEDSTFDPNVDDPHKYHTVEITFKVWFDWKTK